MRKFILDTDIGVDCDDAAAIAMTLNYQKAGKCQLLAITASSARKGATSAIQAICKYYGVDDMPIGKMSAPALACDLENNYSLAVMEKYGEYESSISAVELMRKTLTEEKEKISLIAIGPLSNIRCLLQSEGDEYSPLSGKDLVKEKVDCLYLMGGAFAENYDGVRLPKREIFSEWNILQDIPSARYVAENFPCKMLYCPHETGNSVYTELGKGENPVWYSMLSYAKNKENNLTGEGFRRMSWDPITCMVAIDGVEPFYSTSKPGRIVIDEKGITKFDGSENAGHRYLRLAAEFNDISAYINTWIEKR